jgi:asparagine synthase (glutamine-hydrolysing)
VCGICGAASMNPARDAPETVSTMNALLSHRGPDSDGQEGPGRIILAMRRLAIIDLQTGDQPMPSADRSVWAVLNGEIYNFRSLRKELEALGHKFVTNSDTEVVANGYVEWGPGVVKRLIGMFALAIHDDRTNELFLARDRFGEKPLFYYESGGDLYFSSELKSLMSSPSVPRFMDREALAYYLRFGYAPVPLTLLKDVFEIEPGCTLLWSGGKTHIERYFTPDYTPDPEFDDPEVAIAAVRDALEAAVSRQMVSDVPLGAFLSGGIDSSAVVAMMQRSSDRPVKTFTVRFGDAAYDEGDVARTVATHLGTDHHEISVDNLGFSADDLWRIIDHVGQPFADSSAIPTFILSSAVRDSVTVCLTGDGGDDMFAGYDRFRWGAQIDNIGRIPRPALRTGKLALDVARSVPGLRTSGMLRQAGRAFEAAIEKPELRFTAIESIFSTRELSTLLSDDETLRHATGSVPLMSSLPEGSGDWTPLRRRMYMGINQTLPRDYLVKTDRMSMAASLELRAPMLDPGLADLSMRLPDDMLIRGKVQKYVLREAVRPFLPEVLFSQPKSGFSIPLHRFQNDEYRSLVEDVLYPQAASLGLFRPDETRHIVDRGLGQMRDMADISVFRASHQLWSLLQLTAWSQRFNVTI